MRERLTIKARARLTARGFGVLNKYCPGLARGKALSALVSALQPFASIWFSARIIGEISGARRIHRLVAYVCAVILANFLAFLLRSAIDRITNEKESQMWGFFGKIFADKQMSMDYADLERAEIQYQRKLAEEDLYMFGNGLAQLVWGTAGLVSASVSIFVSISMTATLFTRRSGNAVADSPLWAVALLACVLLGGLSNSRATVRENRIFEKWCEGLVWFNRANQFFGRDLYMSPERAKDVRIYGQEASADRAFGRLHQHHVESAGPILKMSAYPSLAVLVIGVGNAACYLFVVIKAFLGAFGVGSIVQYVGVLSRLGEGVQEMLYILADNEVYCSHLRGLFRYLDIPNRKYQGTLPVEKRAFCAGGDNDYEIEFRDVSFRYPGSEAYALDHVSMKLRIGKRLAVVGQNGSGKTTFIKLLCRLYDPTEGAILLNGIDIRKYDYNEYMDLFSVVFQDFRLFAFQLGQNVAASTDYDRERVEACLKEAGFGDRLRQLPDGAQTCLYKDFDEEGVEISGGEAQKIALARALYKGTANRSDCRFDRRGREAGWDVSGEPTSPFIILDEPTAALDPIAEYEIYSKFSGIVGGRTAIYISHRLSSCRFCDDIAVFHEGRLIQRGAHDALVADEGGKYHALWNAQAQYYRAGA